MRLPRFRNVETFTASLLSLTLLLGMTPTTASAVGHSRPTPATAHAKTTGPKQGVKKSVTQLPSFFEETAGQAGGRARFVSRGAGDALLLGAGGVTLALKR